MILPSNLIRHKEAKMFLRLEKIFIINPSYRDKKKKPRTKRGKKRFDYLQMYKVISTNIYERNKNQCGIFLFTVV